ncbi:MAG: AAA family ATPase [Deltaproteobacteria bacterium]|nr:AAA family ATPase [Deltaproteobacteria bacterium]
MTERDLNIVREFYNALLEGLNQIIIGQEDIKQFLILSLFCEGNVLLEGMPGLGKTVSVKSLARLLGLTFKRVQFTPDLMPSDILGSEVLETAPDGKKELVFKYGPVFTNFLLADEINRASPKTQAALLEAMEEKQVSVHGNSIPLPRPFFVVATQNPVELEGTYPLPEAQLDRFIVKLVVRPPTEDQLVEVINQESSKLSKEINPVLPTNETLTVLELAQRMISQVIISEKLLRVIARIVTSLNPLSPTSPSPVKQFIKHGPGPRASIALAKLAKARALSRGNIYVSLEDIRDCLSPALRHRIILSFEAEAEQIDADTILEDIKTF